MAPARSALRPRRVAAAEITLLADGTYRSYCPTCRKRWVSARHESRSWVDTVAAYHRQLHRERRI